MFRNLCIAGALVLALCTAGVASAMPLDSEMAEVAEGTGFLGGLWDRLLDWIERMVGEEGGDGGLAALEMEGCHLDPNGSTVCGGGS